MRMRVKLLPQWGYWRDSVFYGTCVPHIWPSLQLKVISPRGPIFASYFFRLKAKRSKTDTVLLPFRFAKLINQFFASFRFKFFSSCCFTFLSINFLLQFVLLRVKKKLNFKPILGIFARVISFRMPKNPFHFKAKQSKLTFCFAISLCSFPLLFRFEAKWGDTLISPFRTKWVIIILFVNMIWWNIYYFVLWLFNHRHCVISSNFLFLHGINFTIFRHKENFCLINHSAKCFLHFIAFPIWLTFLSR